MCSCGFVVLSWQWLYLINIMFAIFSYSIAFAICSPFLLIFRDCDSLRLNFLRKKWQLCSISFACIFRNAVLFLSGNQSIFFSPLGKIHVEYKYKYDKIYIITRLARWLKFFFWSIGSFGLFPSVLLRPEKKTKRRMSFGLRKKIKVKLINFQHF